MKVLHVIPYLTLGDGVSRYVLNISNHIDAIDFDILVVSGAYMSADDTALTKFKAKGGKIYELNHPGYRGLYAAIRNFLITHRGEYSAIHLGVSGHVTTLIYSMAARHSGPWAIIAHSHTAWPHKGVKSRMKRFLLRAARVLLMPVINRHVDHRFACSRAAAEYLFGNEYRAEIRKNAIDTKRFAYSDTIRKQVREEILGLFIERHPSEK